MAATDNLGPVAGLGPTIQEQELLPDVKVPTGTVGRALKSGGYGAMKSVARFAEGTLREAGLNGLADTAGAKAEQLGSEQERMAPPVMAEEDIRPDQYVDYYLAHLFANLPQMAGTVGLGIAGRGVGGRLFRGGALRGAMANAGGAAGAFGSTFVQNTGEIYDEQRQAGVDDFGLATQYGAMAGALDALAPAAILAKVGLKPAAATLKNRGAQLVKDMLVGTAAGGATEGLTESAQEELAIRARAEADPSYDINSLEAYQRRQQAAILGTLIGGTFGAGGGVVRSALRPAQPAPAPAPGQPPTPETLGEIPGPYAPLPGESGLQVSPEAAFGQPARPRGDFLDHMIDFYGPPQAPGPIDPGTDLASFQEGPKPLKTSREAALARAESMGRPITEQEEQSAARQGNFKGYNQQQHQRDEGVGSPAGTGGGGIAVPGAEVGRPVPGAAEGLRRQAAEEALKRRDSGIPPNATEAGMIRELERERAEAARPIEVVEGSRQKQPIPEPAPKTPITAELPLPSKREGGESIILGERQTSRRDREEAGEKAKHTARGQLATAIGERVAASDLNSTWSPAKQKTVRSVVEKVVAKTVAASEGMDAASATKAIRDSLDTALKGVVVSGERDAFIDSLLGEKSSQGELFSRAATVRPLRGKMAFAHWGNVPSGTTNPAMIGQGVPGRDQEPARRFGVQYTSAVTLDAYGQGLYREPAVQSRTPYVGLLDLDRVYDMANYRQDPRWELAKQRTAKKYGPDQTAAIYEFQRILQADPNIDAALFPDGQLRIFKPAKVYSAPTYNQIAAHASKALDIHQRTGGSTTDLITGVDHVGAPVFSVSPYKEREIRIVGQPTAEQIGAYVRKNLDALSTPGHALGTWFNPDDGMTYLDVVIVEKNMQTALNIARDAEQLAIFDLRSFTTISLNDPLFEAAQLYAAQNGLPPIEPITYREVRPELHRRIALAYDALPESDPNPATVESFRAWAMESEQQFRFLQSLGYVMEVFPEVGVQPYKNSAEMRADVFGKKHLWIFNGGEAHPILTPDQIHMGRAVHDLFAHAKTGFEFGPRGEMNAFRAEAQLYSAKALPALASDSLGQNAWVNYHPSNEGKPAEERAYPVQKAALLPQELVDEVIDDVLASRRSVAGRADRIMSAKGQDALDYIAKITGAPSTLQVVLLEPNPERGYAGRITLGRIKDLIELAYDARDITSVAAHEGYHFVEMRLLSATERAIVERGFAKGTDLYNRTLANARAIDATDGTSLAAEIEGSGHEARAYGFEQWRRGDLEVKGPVAKVFAKLRQLLERIRNYLDGLGFRSTQDIFHAIDRGQYSRDRRARIKAVDQSAFDTWLKNVEPDVLEDLEFYDSRLARVEAYTPSQEHAKGPLAGAGRPPQIKGRADLERIRQRVQLLAEEGLKYGAGDWHERSAKGALMLADGDVDRALTVAALISNFSPRSMVGEDLGKALTALARYAAGQPLTIESVRAPGQHVAAAEKILGGDILTGRKRVSFLKNMMYYLDTDTFHDAVQGATIDMWMAHIFGYANNTSGALKNEAQYDWAEAETFRVANKLGAKAWEVQAAIWVALRARANRVRGVADALGNRYGWFEEKTVTSKDGTKTKVVAVRQDKTEAYLNAWMDAAMEVGFDADAFRESNVSYLEAADKLAMGATKFRAPAEFSVSGKKYRLDDIGPAIRTSLRTRGFNGQFLSDLSPRTFLGQMFSRAAIGEINQKIASGDFERGRLFGNVRDAMAGADVPESNLKTLFGGAIDTAKGNLDGVTRAFGEWIGTGMATADKSAGFRNVFNPLSFFDQRKKRLFTDMIDRHLGEWTKFSTTEAELKRVTRVLLNRTINGWAADSGDWANARASLTDHERVLVDQARRMIDTALDIEFASDKVTYARSLGADSPAYREWLTRRAEQVERLKASGYFPERRYGDHTVHVFVRDPQTGKRITLAYEQYESKAQALHRLNGTAGIPGMKTIFADVAGAEVEYGFRYAPEVDGSLSFQRFLDMANAAGIDLTQAEKERIARKLLDADSTKMNRIFRRENVPGMSEEGLRVLAEMAEVAANRVAYGEFHPAVQEARKGNAVTVQFNVQGAPQFTVTPANVWAQDGGMAGHYRRLADEVVEVAMSSRPDNAISGQLRAFASFQFLGGSVAAAMVNMSSLWMATAPYLSQYTNGNPLSAARGVLDGLRRAGANFSNLSLEKLDNPNVNLPGIDEIPGLRDALKIGIQDGTLQDTEIYQFMGLSRGQLLSKGRVRRAAADVWMAPFRMMEKLNRTSTFLAAYDIGRARNLTGDALYKFAQEAVHRTQLRYDEVNRPKLARNGLGAILMTFKTFPLGMIELFRFLGAHDKRAAAYMLTALVLAAGVEGLPFAEDLMDLVDTIAGRVFKSPFNSKRAIRNMVKNASEAIGVADMSGLVMHGLVNWFTGSQFASRVGLGDIIPGTRAFAVDADFKEVALNVLGPVGSMTSTFATGLAHLSRGDFDKALKQGAPLAVSNLYKGVEQGYRGYATDLGGRKLVDISGWEAFMQGIGFSSARLAEAYDLDRIDRRTQAFVADVRQQFTDDLVAAFRDGRQDRVQKVIADVAAWNAAHPNAPVVLNGGSIRRTIALAGVGIHERTLRQLPRALRAQSESFRAYKGEDGVE